MKLSVSYKGRTSRPVYQCTNKPKTMVKPGCIYFDGARAEEAVANELLRAVSPMAVEAAKEAETQVKKRQQKRLRIAELELEKAEYEASLAERRYAACDPDNRLIAARLEKSWEAALQQVESCRRAVSQQVAYDADLKIPDFKGLAEDLEAAWNATGTTMRTRQRILRTLVENIVVDTDTGTNEIVLVIHWKGDQHSSIRVKKRKHGEHGRVTCEDALEIMRSMAGRWSDEHIAATLNRMGLRSAYNNTWTANRVGVVRRHKRIKAYLSADKSGEWCTMTEAARELGVTNHTIRRLIRQQILKANQVVPRAPYQIRRSDLQSEAVRAALEHKNSPCRTNAQNQLPMFSDT